MQPPIVETFDDEKVRKSPPDSEKGRDREVSAFSMSALPIPLGPLGGLTGNL